MLAVVIALAAGALVVSSSNASIAPDGSALARVQMPTGGGTIERVSAVTGPHSRSVAVTTRGNTIWPAKLVPAGTQVSIDATIKRPGWISWLAGSTDTVHLTVTAPTASLRSHFVTVRGSAPVTLHFKSPVAVLITEVNGHPRRRVLSSPSDTVTLARTGEAGTTSIAAAPRSWETAHMASVSWFPAGAGASAVASPAPGTPLAPDTPITLTFNKPVREALNGAHPVLSPQAAGSWQTLGSHSVRFTPTGYGYGLGAKVSVGLPSGVHLAGGQGVWRVPAGSTMRAQQILALLGYLPLSFHYQGAGVGLTTSEQLAAAVKPPAGAFHWKWSDTPSSLKGFWSPGADGTMTRGAIMAFESDHGLTADGDAGPQTWKALISAVLSGHRSSFGYSYVSVSVPDQRLTLWHNGHDVIGSTPVNTGISSAPTATGTYPVYERFTSTTMSGTNPDGSHYHDTGIPWVSYFNGGDALHGFTRGSYGSPQSLGCVEMPFSVAGQVYPYTPIGTLVHVA